MTFQSLSRNDDNYTPVQFDTPVTVGNNNKTDYSVFSCPPSFSYLETFEHNVLLMIMSDDIRHLTYKS